MWERLYRIAVGYLLRLGLSPADAEDIAQEALISTYLHADGVPEGRLTAYVMAVAKNRYVDLVRKNRREFAGLSLDPGSPAWPSETDRIETRVEIERALGRLNLTEQKLFHLKYSLDLSTAEISARLNTSRHTVKTLLWRLRRKLREYLEEGRGS